MPPLSEHGARIPSSPARWRSSLPLFFVFFSLLALLVAPLALTRRTMAVRAEIAGRVEPARAALTEINLSLAREVASVRGYLLTGDTTLLGTYERSRAAERAHQARLEAIALELSPELHRHAALLRERSDEWNRENPTLRDRAPPAQLSTWLPRRQQIYDRLLAQAVELGHELTAEAEQRRDRIRRLERLSAWLTVILTALAGLSVGFLLLTGRRLSRLAARDREARARLAGEAERLEHSVAQRTAELSEANDELQAFAHSVSHDFRAPVRAITGFSQALMEDAGPRLERDEREYLDRIHNAALRMDLLIDDLLAYARLARSEIRLEPVSLDAVVREAAQDTHAGSTARSEGVIIAGAMPRVVAHRATLVQAVQNLLSNSLKFVPPGRDPCVSVRVEERGDVARLWVEDNGIGIATEHQERIFRVFERLHGVESYPGTGIGLAIVRRAVERMGGSVGVESTVGTGSRFWIELPLAKEATR